MSQGCCVGREGWEAGPSQGRQTPNFLAEVSSLHRTHTPHPPGHKTHVPPGSRRGPPVQSARFLLLRASPAQEARRFPVLSLCSHHPSPRDSLRPPCASGLGPCGGLCHPGPLGNRLGWEEDHSQRNTHDLGLSYQAPPGLLGRMGFLLQLRAPSRTPAHADGRLGSPGPEGGLEEGTQPPPGSAPGCVSVIPSPGHLLDTSSAASPHSFAST